MWHFQELDWEKHRLECAQSQLYMHNTSKYIYENSCIPDKDIIHLVGRMDASETLNSPGKWPRTFSCDKQKCPKCQCDLSSFISKKQKHKSDKKLLITTRHAIEINILSKKCQTCHLIMRPDTLSYGLLNIGDTALVSLDIFFSLRNTIRYNTYKGRVTKHVKIRIFEKGLVKCFYSFFFYFLMKICLL